MSLTYSAEVALEAANAAIAGGISVVSLLFMFFYFDLLMIFNNKRKFNNIYMDQFCIILIVESLQMLFSHLERKLVILMPFQNRV